MPSLPDPDRPRADPDRPRADPDRPRADPDRPRADPDRPQADPDRRIGRRLCSYIYIAYSFCFLYFASACIRIQTFVSKNCLTDESMYQYLSGIGRNQTWIRLELSVCILHVYVSSGLWYSLHQTLLSVQGHSNVNTTSAVLLR